MLNFELHFFVVAKNKIVDPGFEYVRTMRYS